jgi:hypothetical protein
MNCVHKSRRQTNDGNRTQQCTSCGKVLVKDGIIYDSTNISRVRNYSYCKH